jgi:hypothetical protein
MGIMSENDGVNHKRVTQDSFPLCMNVGADEMDEGFTYSSSREGVGSGSQTSCNMSMHANKCAERTL